MRLIDADKIKYWEIDEVGGEYSSYMGCSKEYIDEMPTISIIEELENLKAEFEKEIEIKKKQNYSLDFFTGISDCIIITKNRIDELKGE